MRSFDGKELFRIALRYIEKEYSSDQLRDGDDLYSASAKDKSQCEEYYSDIKRNGTNWAYERLDVADMMNEDIEQAL